jgi:8-oxo-dGTP pyrophosphatase MutT (NUDIX family)
MRRKKGGWQVEETVERYKNRWLEVCEDRVIRPDEQAGSFVTVKMRPGVSVLAMDEARQVYLTSEFRYAVERESIEVVSGGVEAGELPLSAARRELREELGIEAAEWTDLGSIDPFTSLVHSPATLFLARNLSFVDPDCDDTEIIQLVKMKLSEAVRMVMESEITHGPSCVLILKTNHFLNSEKAGISGTDSD